MLRYERVAAIVEAAMSEWRFDLVPGPAAGAKAEGRVDWGDPVLAGWEWPYVAVNGAAPGPAVLVTAGIHGSEYCSIDAAIRLGAALEPERVRGQLLCLPVMNPSAFWERAAYVSPVDNLNLNRVFPGKPTGSFSERVAHHLTQKAIRRADAYIDMHGGDIPEALVPFTIYQESGRRELDAKSAAMAEAFGSPALLVQRDAEAPVSGLAYATAAAFDVPAILVEDGGAGRYDAAIAGRMLEGVENVLRSLEVLPGGARNLPPPRRFERFSWIRSEAAGFFRHEIEVGEDVAAGQRLGRLVDFHGAEIEEVRTPDAGRVLFLVVSPAIGRKGLICGIGVGAG